MKFSKRNQRKPTKVSGGHTYVIQNLGYLHFRDIGKFFTKRPVAEQSNPGRSSDPDVIVIDPPKQTESVEISEDRVES